MKILAIGDIHTKTWIIDIVETVIDNYDAVVFVGDYADNWGASAQESINVWTRLFILQQEHQGKVYAVRGNHDYIYTVDTPTKQSGYNYETQALINNQPQLKAWVTSLPLILELDGVTYSHAGIDERWSGEQTVSSMWNDESPIWVRPDWAKYKKIPQVFGHTPSHTCWEVEKDIWCIDSFSQYPNGTPFGDGTMLEVTDGKQFNKTKINANHHDSSSFEDRIS